MMRSFNPTALIGRALPQIELAATTGGSVDLSLLDTPRSIIYCYPRTSVPGQPAPSDWDMIPGSRGCTPQACTFRDHHKELAERQAQVFGLSTQSTGYQQEMAERLHLPFAVLSDEQFKLIDALDLPTSEADGMRLIERLTLIVRRAAVEAVLYPVREPERSAAEVIAWLDAHPL